MTILDKTTVSRPSEIVVRPPPRPWNSGDTAVVLWVFGGAVLVVLLTLIIRPIVLQARSRTFVLDQEPELAKRMANLDHLANSSDVKPETRDQVTQISNSCVKLKRVLATGTKIDWIALHRAILQLMQLIYDVGRDVKRQVDFADEARKNGPELMKQLPGMIAAAEKKLSEGKQSAKAKKHLAEARAAYDQAKQKFLGLSMTDWVIIYVILSAAQSDCKRAESAHHYANTDHSDSSSSRSSSSSHHDYGHGSSSGFGGGGGFDSGSGGGGASGGW